MSERSALSELNFLDKSLRCRYTSLLQSADGNVGAFFMKFWAWRRPARRMLFTSGHLTHWPDTTLSGL